MYFIILSFIIASSTFAAEKPAWGLELPHPKPWCDPDVPHQGPVTPPRLLKAHELTQEHAQHLAPLASRIVETFDKDRPVFYVNRVLFNMFGHKEVLELFRQQHRVPCVANWLDELFSCDLLDSATITLLDRDSKSETWLREAFNAIESAKKSKSRGNHADSAKQLAKACKLLGGTNSDWDTFCSLQENALQSTTSRQGEELAAYSDWAAFYCWQDPSESTVFLDKLATYKGSFSEERDTFYAELIKILYPKSKFFKAF